MPNVMRSRPYQSCLASFRSVMAEHGVLAIEMWDDLTPRRAASDIAGVYIGGCDTAMLFMEVREKGFDAYLHEVVSHGTPIYGGSAGVVILGKDNRTTQEALHLSHSDTMGFKLVTAYSIVCHYKPENKAETRKLSKTLGQSLVAVPEKAGGHVMDKSITTYGTEPIMIFREGEMETVEPLGVAVL